MTSEPMVLFVGPRDAGKFTAIASVSDTPVISVPLDSGIGPESHTDERVETITFGQLDLAGEGTLRLCAIPDPESSAARTPLELRADGLVVLVDGRASDADCVLDRLLDRYGDFCRDGTAVVGITRTEAVEDEGNLLRYQQSMMRHRQPVPIYLVDARDQVQMLVLLSSLVEMLRLRVTEATAN